MFVRTEAYSFKPGDRVISQRDFESCAGKFMAPHRFTVESCGDRGYNLVDDEGNRLREAGFVGFMLESAYLAARENWR